MWPSLPFRRLPTTPESSKCPNPLFSPPPFVPGKGFPSRLPGRPPEGPAGGAPGGMPCRADFYKILVSPRFSDLYIKTIRNLLLPTQPQHMSSTMLLPLLRTAMDRVETAGNWGDDSWFFFVNGGPSSTCPPLSSSHSCARLWTE
jgi:hypothetical protein